MCTYSPARYCSADNVYCSLGAFTFYATTGSTLFLQAVLAITRYNFVCSLYRSHQGEVYNTSTLDHSEECPH